MPAILLDKIFNPWDEIQRHQAEHLQPGHYGATATFVGTMRDFNISESVSHMRLEHYPAMTQHYLDNLCTQCIDTYDLDDCLVIHRFGEIRPGEPIVLTAAWSGHRAQAFDACRYLMEELKARAPFWKKEVTETGERWVHNDQQAEK
ncbi:MAG: molybdenum cofactor biosynthesis protein MoaE [Gammaproteobacteria bacterium]|nr:molybdenum cofactor biosynthesis protein MoaE [Gammaproteobacteria bacterium]NNJ49121.1 molybdenum cofactor biosynthesis protein MoaE [Gammaproteobacteria bacterium]